jgi:ATP-binding cassette, subfamily B, multidrug efflux pump
MQTALGVRETVLKFADVGVYILVYFLGTLILMAQADLWLVLPLVVWLAAYVGLLYYYVPRLGKIGELQADARALMTGRVVDSYTNIQTVKLFAHTSREHDYARNAMDEFMQTVYRQMRLLTALTTLLQVINALPAGLGGGHCDLRLADLADLARRDRRCARAGLRLRAMSQWIMWEVATCSRTSARCRTA